MRKYGVNWLLFYLGFVIAVGTGMFWASQMLDLLWPSHGGNRGMSRPVMWGSQAILQGVLVFWLARENAKEKVKAAQAMEGKPFVPPGITDGKTSNGVFVTHTKPLSVRVRNSFGISSAIVGSVTVAAHLVSGRPGIPLVTAYTLGVPLCLAFGIYLTGKAREPAATEAAALSDQTPFPQTNQSATRTQAPTVTQPTQEAQPVSISQGR